ncbi:Rv1733c family protein [Streptomyces blattellae]|uniref:Rv1733c family protein n=1 Tax=Streptomyces blattellae TaxID=2569855 RepID=UPI0012B7ED00|nr:hypothetical protein [Streptomyces blattellae]
MRTLVRGWRWRPSPLRRRSDIVEAWTVVVVAVLLCVGTPLAGAVAAWWAHGEARDTAAAQRAERRQVRAEVVGAASGSVPSTQGGTSPRRMTVRWTEPGQGERTARALVPPGSRPGERVHVWFDSRGRSVTPPLDSSGVWQHTLAMGLCATGGAVAVVLLGHGAVRHVAMHHRLTEWEREWARTEPEWTRRWA